MDAVGAAEFGDEFESFAAGHGVCPALQDFRKLRGLPELGGRLVRRGAAVFVPAAVEPEDGAIGSGDEAEGGRHDEGQAESLAEGSGDEVGEEAPTRQVRGVDARLRQQVVAEQLVDRVDPEEGGEEAPDG